MKKKLLRILIIEDNIDHAELLSEVIERHFDSVDLHSVESMDDAADFIEQTDYDIVFTDCYINDASIADQIPKLKEKLGDIPLIVITGSGDENLAAEVIKSGASEYLVKTKDSLEKIPVLIKKHAQDSKKTHPAPVKLSQGDTPLKEMILDEMATLNRAAQKMTSSVSGRTPDIGQLESLLDQIQRLKELASRIIEKK